MTDDVYDCFQCIINQRKRPKKEPKVDGLKGFLYLDKNDMPMVALHWEKYFEHLYTYWLGRCKRGIGESYQTDTM